MSNKKSLWIPLAGSILLLLLVVLAILSASSTLSFADTPPRVPAAVEGIDSWTWRGPSHDTAAGLAPEVNAIVIDSANPAIIYAATNQGVYRSTDTGGTWEPRNEGLGGYGGLVVTDLEIDPTNHQRLVISTWGYGLAQSTDSGLHWTRLSDPLASLDLQPSAALDPDAPQVRVGGASNTKPIEVSDLLKKSLSSGVLLPQPWPAAEEQVESPQAVPEQLPWTPVRQVAIHPSNPDQLFACIDGDHGLYASNDGGASWSPVSLGTGSARTYTFAPSNSLIRYASFGSWSTSGGFYRTTNGGADWDDVGSGYIAGTVTAVAIHPTNSDFVLAATSGDGLYRSTNGGDSWTNVSTPSSLPDVDFFSVAYAPDNPNVAYAGGHYEVYRSGDGGATWANADASFPTDYVVGLAIHPTSSSTVLVGAADRIWGGVYKRTSDGSPFALTATGMTDTFVLDIEQDPNDADVLYAATWGAGALRSDDGGLTWNARLAFPYVTCLEATQGPTGTILYAGTFYNTWGVLKSWDRGETWKEISKYNSSDQSLDIKSLDGGPDHLVAATGYGVEYSNDGGETWVDATGLDQGLVLKIAQSPFDPDWLMAATFGGGVWSSTNGGSSWVETSAGLGIPYVYDVVFAPWDSDTAYAASLGVYRTADGGATWSLSGISGMHVRSLDARGAPGYDVFAGTVSQGVYVAPQHINLWLDLNQGLDEHRTLSLIALDYDTLFAGTNGRGAWEYTIVNLPQPEQIYLPLVLRNYTPPVLELVNGGFEQGPDVGWGQHSDKGWYLILPASELVVTPHSGTWAAWLGGDDDEFAVIWQDVTVPADDPWLRFYHWDASGDACGNDYGYVYVNAGYPYAAWELCESNNTDGWVWGGVNLSAYAGQIVEIAIAADTNGSVNSNLFIDDVTLGSTSLADFGAQEAPRALDPAVSKHGLLPDPSRAEEPGQRPWFLPLQEPLEPQSLLNLSD